MAVAGAAAVTAGSMIGGTNPAQAASFTISCEQTSGASALQHSGGYICDIFGISGLAVQWSVVQNATITTITDSGIAGRCALNVTAIVQATHRLSDGTTESARGSVVCRNIVP